MKTSLKNPKIIAGAATILFCLTLFGFMNQYRIKSELQGNLNEQRLYSEGLLSEKLSLEKDLHKFRSDANTLRGMNVELDRQLASSLARISSREMELKKLQHQANSLSNYKKQYEVMVNLKKELEHAMDGLSAELAQARFENQRLVRTVADLEDHNAHLKHELDRVVIASLDQPRIEAVKGRKEKLTIVARKTREIKVNVDIPVHLKEVTFQIKDQNGKIINRRGGSIAVREIEDTSTITASTEGNPVVSKSTKKVEMVYKPEERLQPGIYTVEILSERFYVGSIQVKLK